MSRTVILRNVAALGLAAALVACESLESILNPPPPPVTVGLTVRPADSTLRVGESVQLTAEAEYEDGTIEEVRAQWRTTSDAVTVDFQGVVTVNDEADDVIVWASFRNQQAKATLTAIPACAEPAAGATVDVRVTGVEVVQVVDLLNRGLPVLAGKDVLVRALVERTGDADASSLPHHVTVAVTRGGEEVGTAESQVGCGEITNDLSTLQSTLYAVVPAEWLGDDLGLVVTAHLPAGVDAGAASQLRYPAVGSLDLDFVEPAPFDITFVPIVLDVAAAVFDDDGALDAIAWPREILPLDVVNVDVRAPYTLSIPSTDEGAQGRVLQELRELRLLDGASAYYHGILPPTTPEGWSAGRGYIRIPVAVSAQYEIGRVSGGVVAHELGHNMSLRHAPCGAAALPDDDYPYLEGVIGVYGYGPRLTDLEVDVLHTPDTADLMGYCWPQWISDYAYEKVLEFRANEASSVAMVNAAVPSTTVLVSGSVGGAEGAVVRPLFVTATEPSPPLPGQLRFEMLSADGAVLLSVPFDASEIGGGEPGDARDFAFTIAVPTSDLDRATSARVVSVSGEVLTELHDDLEPGEVRPLTAPTVSREAGGVVIEWDAATYPAAVIVDRASGTVVGRGVGGRARVSNVGPELELVLSSGLRSVTVIVPVR